MDSPTTPREYKGLPLTIAEVIARYLRQIADGPACVAELQRLGFEGWRDSFRRSHQRYADEGGRNEWDSRDYTDEEMRLTFDGVIACASRTIAENETWEDIDRASEAWVRERRAEDTFHRAANDVRLDLGLENESDGRSIAASIHQVIDFGSAVLLLEGQLVTFGHIDGPRIRSTTVWDASGRVLFRIEDAPKGERLAAALLASPKGRAR